MTFIAFSVLKGQFFFQFEISPGNFTCGNKIEKLGFWNCSSTIYIIQGVKKNSAELINVLPSPMTKLSSVIDFIKSPKSPPGKTGNKI